MHNKSILNLISSNSIIVQYSLLFINKCFKVNINFSLWTLHYPIKLSIISSAFKYLILLFQVDIIWSINIFNILP